MLKNENDDFSIGDPFKVYVRVRPLLEREFSIDENFTSSGNNLIPKNKIAVMVEDKNVYVIDQDGLELYGKKEKCFQFDDVFKDKDNNGLIFDQIVKNLVLNTLSGYNSTALAYGVTGTGKTHTMFGDIHLNLNFEKGICMYAVDYLFEQIKSDIQNSIKIKISYLEIYNESVIDLLIERPQNLSNDQHLMIVEDPIRGTIVPELTEFIVSNSDQVTNLIILGNSRRTMAPTGANQFSSRSHAILQINLEQIKKDKDEIISSKLLLVDLAGSERGSQEKGIRREEGANINKSLLALGNCINILSDKSKKGSFVPYRDSKLTRLLKDSLGGNIATVMIACISPSYLSYDETINTLKYASRARKIQKKVTRNVKELDPAYQQNKEIVDNLKNEILQLKEIIKNQNILLRNKPDSFREDKDFINFNLNLNLNFNNSDPNNQNNQNYQKQLSNENNNFNFVNSNKISNHFVTPNDDLFYINENKNTFNFFNTCEDVFDPNYTDDQNKFKNNFKQNDINKIKEFDFENYEKFLIKNYNNFTDDDFKDFEKKLEGLYFDKIRLEEQITQGNKDTTINEKYTIVKQFYEKYVELINEKIIENIEHNMVLKFNLKDILELNQLNSINEEIRSNLEEIQKLKLLEDKINIEKIIEDNEKEKENISKNLENNIQIKKTLKRLLLKFIKNTQIKEFKNLQLAYVGVENDKRELEVKNKKYQEFLNTILKEKDDKDIKIIDLNRELEKIKKKLLEKDKKLIEAEKKIKDLEIQINEHKLLQKTIYKTNSKSMSVRKRSFYDDTELRIKSNRRYFYDKINKLIIKKASFKTNSYNYSKSNKIINIDLYKNIPRVTAILHGTHIYKKPSYSNNFANSANCSITNLRQNLHKNNSRSRSAKKSNNLEQFVDSHLKYKNNLIKNNSLKSFNKKRPNFIQTRNEYKINNNKRNDDLINLKDFIRDISNNKNKILNSNHININNNEHQNNLKIISPNNNLNINNIEKQLYNLNNLNNNFNDNDSVSISAVTYTNEICLNSSELEIMENVLNLDGINTGIYNKTNISGNIKNIKKYSNNNNYNTYAQKFINKNKNIFGSNNENEENLNNK